MPSLIYVVDSDIAHASSVQKLLNGAGYAVTTFREANLCLDAIEVNSPDLILSEVALPDMDGFTLCRSVRYQAKTPFVFMSLSQDAQSIKNAFESGGTDFLGLPSAADQVLGMVRKILSTDTASQQLCPDPEPAGAGAVGGERAAERMRRIAGFMDQCALGRSPDRLAEELFRILNPMGLRGSLLVRVPGKQTFFSDGPGKAGLEEKYLAAVSAGWDEHLAGGGQMHEAEGLLVIGFKHLSLLIRNYVADRHQQHLDFLFGFLKGMEMVVFSDAQQRHQAMLYQHEAAHLWQQADGALSNMRATLSSCETRMMNVMTLLVNEMGIQVEAFDLPPDDEQKVMSLVEDVMEDLVQIYADSVHIDSPLSDVMQDFRDFLNTAFSADKINFNKRVG